MIGTGMYYWHALNFVRMDDLPFDVWMEMDGAEAGIYVTCVGNHNKELEQKLGYVEGLVHTMPLNPDTVGYLRMLVDKLAPHGVAVLFQRKPPVPEVPGNYDVIRCTLCQDEQDGHSCDYYHDGYCEKKKGHCEHRKKALSVYIKGR